MTVADLISRWISLYHRMPSEGPIARQSVRVGLGIEYTICLFFRHSQTQRLTWPVVSLRLKRKGIFPIWKRERSIFEFSTVHCKIKLKNPKKLKKVKKAQKNAQQNLTTNLPVVQGVNRSIFYLIVAVLIFFIQIFWLKGRQPLLLPRATKCLRPALDIGATGRLSRCIPICRYT